MNAGAFKKGEKRPKQGRPKGTPNKVTADIKSMVLGALSQAGGVDYLTNKAESHPAAFLALVGRVLPLQIAGDANAPLVIKVVAITSEQEQAAAWKKPA